MRNYTRAAVYHAEQTIKRAKAAGELDDVLAAARRVIDKSVASANDRALAQAILDCAAGNPRPIH